MSRHEEVPVDDEPDAGTDDEELTSLFEGDDEPAPTVELDAAAIDRRKALIDFDDEDARRLAALDEQFQERADEVADRIHDTLTEDETFAECIERSSTDDEEFERIQRAHWTTLTDGTYGSGHFEAQAGVGVFHEDLAVPFDRYVGQYGLYVDAVLSALADRTRERVTETLAEEGVDEETIAAVTETLDAGAADARSACKVLNLDLQVGTAAYVGSRERGLEDEIERRREIADETQGAARDLKDFTSDVSKSAKRIADLAETEADNVTEIRAEMSNLSATIEEIAATSDQVEETSERALESAVEGQQSASAAMGLLEDIEESATAIEGDVTDLESRTREIGEIVDVIDDIAEQTNILALNASIEAARAGEAGAGFAVVADEVKDLAEESQAQADHIESVIGTVQTDIEDTVDHVERTTERIETGIERVEDALAQLDEIVAIVEDAAAGVQEVAVATDDQAETAEEVATMIEDAADRITEISAEIDEVATASEQQTAKVFKVTSDLKQLSEEY